MVRFEIEMQLSLLEIKVTPSVFLRKENPDDITATTALAS